jgi:hypothetical protein
MFNHVRGINPVYAIPGKGKAERHIQPDIFFAKYISINVDHSGNIFMATPEVQITPIRSKRADLLMPKVGNYGELPYGSVIDILEFLASHFI